jgi:hypothetical protein
MVEINLAILLSAIGYNWLPMIIILTTLADNKLKGGAL